MIKGESDFNFFLRLRLQALKNLKIKKDNTFLSLYELTRKVNINIPFTLHYGLIATIPAEWKKIIYTTC